MQGLGLAILVASSTLGACSGGNELTVADLTAEERTALDSVSCGPTMELQPAYFDPMSADLTLDAQRRLIGNVYVLLRCPGVPVRITGWVHAVENDSLPGLPARRADQVYRFYQEHGVGDEQVACIVEFGEDPIIIPFEATGEELRDYLEDPRSRRVDTYPNRDRADLCLRLGGRQPE